MPRNHVLKVRVDGDQKEKIEVDAKIQGFRSVSQYMRHLAIGEESNVLKKLHEIHEKNVRRSIKMDECK
jgi:hypothetical protein